MASISGIARRAVRQAGARDHVADHPDVGLEGELLDAEAFDQVDAERAQLVAHGRVDAGVAAGHLVARLAGERGQPSHERAADAEDVDVHGPRLSRRAAGVRPHTPHAYRGAEYAGQLARKPLPQLQLPELAGGRARHRVDEFVALRQLPLAKLCFSRCAFKLAGLARRRPSSAPRRPAAARSTSRRGWRSRPLRPPPGAPSARSPGPPS